MFVLVRMQANVYVSAHASKCLF